MLISTLLDILALDILGLDILGLDIPGNNSFCQMMLPVQIVGIWLVEKARL